MIDARIEAVERLIEKMAHEYGDAIASVFGGAVSKEEARAVAVQAAVVLAESVQVNARQIDTATRKHLALRRFNWRP